MLKSAIVAIWALLAATTSAQAGTAWKPMMDIVTGQDWLDACQLNTPDLEALTATAACDYYMRGVIQATYSSRVLSYEQNHVPEAKRVDFYCAPTGTTMHERVSAITAFMARYPALKVGPAPTGIVTGLQAGFPCGDTR